MRLVFMPVALLSGLLAGAIGKRLFERAWGLLDDGEPPRPEQRQAPLARLVVALALEGAVFRLAKGLADRGARRAFAGLTGAWPGEEEAGRE